MKGMTRVRSCWVIAILIASAFLQIAVNAQESDGRETSLEGVWEVTTTPRDCTTGEPIPAAAFVAYVRKGWDDYQLVFQRHPFDGARAVATRTRLE
jgi:hypothetical protein